MLSLNDNPLERLKQRRLEQLGCSFLGWFMPDLLRQLDELCRLGSKLFRLNLLYGNV
jgi:hypothetical protein